MPTLRPEDTILEMVDNIEELYNIKLELFDHWMSLGDAWKKGRAWVDARGVASKFAGALQRGELVRGRYRVKDIDEAAKEIVSEFKEYREAKIKEITERPRGPVERPPLTESEEEFAEVCDKLARQIGIDKVKEFIPVSPEQVRAAFEKGDWELRYLPLRRGQWDGAAEMLRHSKVYPPDERWKGVSQAACVLSHVAKYYYV